MLCALSRIECNNSALVIHQGNITNSNDKNAATAKGHVMDLKLVLFIFFLPFYDRLCLKTASNSFALIFQKDHLLVYSTNHIIESCIEIFKVIKKQLLKTTYVFLIIPRKKMVIFIYKTTIISEFMQMGNLIVKQFSIYGYLWQKKATSEDRNWQGPEIHTKI